MIIEAGYPVMYGPPIKGASRAEGGEQVIESGAANYIPLDHDGQHPPVKPGFASPPAAPFEVVLKVLEQIARAQNQMIGLGFLDSRSTTGPARRFDFAGLNAVLGSFVGDIAQGEDESMQVLSELHGERYTDKMRARYNANFEAVEVEALMRSLGELRDLAPPPESPGSFPTSRRTSVPSSRRPSTTGPPRTRTPTRASTTRTTRSTTTTTTEPTSPTMKPHEPPEAAHLPP
jgi:hypothetical protein